MREMKFLINTLKRTPKLLLAFVIMFTVALAAAPFIFNSEIGSEDYLMAKLFIFFPPVLLTVVSTVIMSGVLNGNKLVPSMSNAKRLYTRAVPLMLIILGVGLSCVMILLYFVFLAVIGADSRQFADTLICGTVVCGCIMLYTPVAARNPSLAIGSYLTLAPTALLVFLIGDAGQKNGFELPLPAAAAMFVGVMAVCAVWCFRISSVLFRRINVKTYNMIQTE